ncbi:DUF4416 family protein [candidate division KSB3 bacterium]|uniref:DUF4416 family protein n=1 Tax=candidate division KSB3 bacterium TaxID=2044937 RepID=A0A9D5JTF2_9BACT|nr:DUF4416 family protein [candidate division KSB3 bacterium]MBD3323770.1 DUF4416 family protein [candidate division KSB3 bacterium]
MAQCHPPAPCKYFVAVLYRTPEALALAKRELSAAWGDFDFEGTDHLFDVTAYYEPEMGAPLSRRLVVFTILMPPTELVEMKLRCNQIEDALAVNGQRIVNLDAGYLDHNKVVLASAKEAGQKIYLEQGIYADLVGRYKAGRYQPFEWSFPDFKDGRYDDELLAIRQIYLQQMRERRRHSL